jgi:hypothetical protein
MKRRSFVKTIARCVFALALLLAVGGVFTPKAEASTIARFSWSCTAGAFCTFTNTGTGGSPGWFFGDSSSGSGSPADHAYSQGFGTSTYNVTLVTWQNGVGYDVTCTISVYRSQVGGDPSTTSGTCG